MEWYDWMLNILIALALLSAHYFKNYWRAVYLAFKLPGPPALPLLGNVLTIRNSKDMEYIGTNFSELYGPIGRTWISIIPFFWVCEPEYLQVILGTNKYSTKNMFYALMHNFLGEGLITDTGDKWKLHRKLLQPHFHVNVLKAYHATFNKNAIVMVENLKNYTEVNIVSSANKFVLDVLHEAVLGIDSTNHRESPFRKGQLFIHHRIAKPWLLLDSIFKLTHTSEEESTQKNVLQTYTRSILEETRRGSLKVETNTKRNLMKTMMEVSEGDARFTEEDIVNETCTFMLAGQDSVGAAMAFGLYFLAAHQDIQDKAFEEINSRVDGSGHEFTFEDVQEMKYLEQCIKETLRLCPSVPVISRRLTEDVTLGKHVFPSGTNFFISPFVTHRLPHIFPDPLKFDPERFSPENHAKIHPYAYIPFSGGPRNCIGYKFALMELKTVISQILKQYHLSLVKGHEELNLSYRITLRAKGGIWLKLQDRNLKNAKM